jgi:hypothetical protein
MNKFLNLIFLIIILFGISCKGSEGPAGPSGDSDKQIRINFGGTWGTNSTSWQFSPYAAFDLIKFNKANYIGVDSIVFACCLVSGSSNDTCFAELYDITDSVSIQNTVLQTNSISWIYQYSGNIYSMLPSKEITLTIRLKNQTSGFASATSSILFLYRH